MSSRSPFHPGATRSLALASTIVAAMLACVGAHASDDTSAVAPVAVARIGSDVITAAELDTRTSDALERRRREFDAEHARLRLLQERFEAQARWDALQNALDDDVLAREARARRKTRDELLGAVRVPPVTDDDVRRFYETYRVQIGQDHERVRDAARELLVKERTDDARRDYVRSLRRKYGAEALLPPPRESVAARGPSRGPADARITLVEFADFQCPFCGRMRPVLERALAAYPKDLRIVFRHLPLESHPAAWPAAEAAACANEQGRFWEMHDALYDAQARLSPEQIAAVAQAVPGVEFGPFTECVASRRHHAEIAADAAAADALAVDGTPALFVNGRMLPGAVTYGQLAHLIDEELALATPRAADAR